MFHFKNEASGSKRRFKIEVLRFQNQTLPPEKSKKHLIYNYLTQNSYKQLHNYCIFVVHFFS